MGKFQQHASFETKEAWVGGEFGEKFARAKFGDEIVNSLPVKSRGKYKGRINATIRWVKVTRPGWVSQGYSLEQDSYAPGYVETSTNKIVAVMLDSDTYANGYVIHAIDGDARHFERELKTANRNPKKAA